MKILLTGATGFIGQALMRVLVQEAHQVIAVARSKGRIEDWGSTGVEIYIEPDINARTDWRLPLMQADVVIHCAALAHGKPGDIRSTNVEGTLNLARQAADAGVSRFIFISSIGVNGRSNSRPFTESDPPRPEEPYAQSKWDAEQGLWEVQQETGLEIVIIRPPLVYGPQAPGNFGTLVRLVEKGIPLPLGSIRNKRTLLALDNLVDLIRVCADHPAAANQVFLAGDGSDLSTTELLRGVANALGRPSRLIPVSPSLLRLGARIVGKKAIAEQLLGSLQVDISKTRNILDWTPVISVEQALARAVPKRIGLSAERKT
tara:strand:+ start:27846 stop:28796 length:951 start_codon:yes stop_codon:yes gene_type:complete